VNLIYYLYLGGALQFCDITSHSPPDLVSGPGWLFMEEIPVGIG
jgi:hypothetical protein